MKVQGRYVKLEEEKEPLDSFDIQEKYAALRDRLAYYLLLQVYTYMQTSGMSGLPDAMKHLAEKAADINVEGAKRYPREKHPEVLGRELARHMGETFSSEYRVEKDESRFKVVLDRCGCIGSVLKRSRDFGFSESESRAIFCGACMGGYRRSSEKLGLKFQGALSQEGCYMDFQLL